MAKPYYNHKTIVLDDNISIYFSTQDTNYGFRHLAELKETSGTGVDYKSQSTTAKCTYYNRTWESFNYQTVGHKVIEKHFGKNSSELIKKFDELMLDKENSSFKLVSMVSKIGGVLTDNQKELNDWNTRMIKAGIPGVSFPDDWNELSEDEKKSRLDKVLNVIQEDK